VSAPVSGPLIDGAAPWCRHCLAMLLSVALGLATTAPAALAQDVALRRVALDAHATSSDAIVVERGALVHTAQFVAEDADGRVSGDVREQTGRVLDQLEAALDAVESSLHWIARLHVYVHDASAVPVIEQIVAARRGTAVLPPMTVVESAPVRDGVLVAMDAIAAVRSDAATRRVVVPALPPQSAAGAHVAVQTAGSFVVVSGRAAQGDFEAGVRGTLEQLHADLEGVSLTWDDVVQIKSFVGDVTRAGDLRELVARQFTAPAPPQVVTEWLDAGAPAEIELIAVGRREDTDGRSGGPTSPAPTSSGLATASQQRVTYVEPIASRFSRVTVVHGGRPVFVGGLFGGSDDPVAQVDEVFDRLARVLEQAGSDMRHLVKATYYVSDTDADARINTIRPGIYDAERPPAASKISVRGTGRPGRGSTLDMLAVTAEP
jgi:enamine deaminase RidA (YjgF/YER057c/UK114 family)